MGDGWLQVKHQEVQTKYLRDNAKPNYLHWWCLQIVIVSNLIVIQVLPGSKSNFIFFAYLYTIVLPNKFLN